MRTALGQGHVSAVIENLEIQIRDAAFRDLRQMLEQMLNDRSILSDDQSARPCEIIHRQRPRRVETLFGPITLSRNYYYHTKAHQGRCPLDQALDLVRGDTPSLAKLICQAATLSTSYARAGTTLAEFAGVALDERKFSRLVADIVPELQAAQATLPQPSDITLPILYLETDGTGTPFRREILVGVKGKQPDGSAHTREAKLGCVFTQTTCDAEGRPQRDPDSTTYVGTYDGCREIGTLLRAEALRRGYAQAQTTVYLGDGAPWIWENARINFPQAIQILDFYHAGEHAGTLAAALHGPGEIASQQQTRWCHVMKHDSAQPIIGEITTLLAEQRDHWPESKTTEIEKQIDYFKTNAERMRYGEFIAAGYFIGSGVVEAGCKTVIGQRMKQSGMFWGETGGQAILKLRCMVLSRNFEEIWAARLPILAQARAQAPRWLPSLN